MKNKSFKALVAVAAAMSLLAGCGGAASNAESKAEEAVSAGESAVEEAASAAESAVEEAASAAESAVEEAASAAESAVEEAADAAAEAPEGAMNLEGVTPGRHVIITTGGAGEPYSLLLEDNVTWTGIDGEMWPEICKRAGWTYEVLRAEGAGATFGQLDAGRADIVSNCYAVNEDRVAKYTVSDPYYGDAQCVVVTPDSDIKEFKDLAGKKVGVLNGQAAQQAIEKLGEELGFEVTLFEDQSAGYQDLSLGRLDAFASTDSAVYQQERATGNEYVILDERLYANDVAFYFAKTDEGKALRDEVNIVLKTMMDDGTTAAIVEKYMFSDMTQLIHPYSELGFTID